MKSKFVIFIISLILDFVVLYAQPYEKSLDKKLNREKPLDLAAGVLNVNNIQTNFYNKGNFAARISTQPRSRGLIYNGIRYLLDLPLWIGIPEGKWTPKIWNPQKQDSVSLGPTVSGGYFMAFGPLLDTDWGPVPGSRQSSFSGDVLLSDIFSVNAENDVPLLTDNLIASTWPEDIYGNRKWPGKWAIDPETNQLIQGLFRADQEILVSFTDVGYAGRPYSPEYEEEFLVAGLRGYDIGIKTEGSILAFNESYNSDFIIMDLNLINQSIWNYTDAYLGIYFNPVLYLIGTVMGSELDRLKRNHHFGYITDEYDYSINKNISYNLGYHFLEILDTLPDTVKISYLGIKLLQTPYASYFFDQNNIRKTKMPEGSQLGLTGWHYFNNWYLFSSQGSLETPLVRGELIQYKVMSGDTSNLLPIEQLRFFYPRTGDLDPNFDFLEQIDIDSIGFPEAKFLMSSGPFDLPSGDTVKFAFAVVFGDSLSDLKTNCRIAQTMYDNNYRRMGPPPPPKVTAVPGDRTVTLYWDDAAEKDVDFLTGYNDFEGYRIYRTSVDPALNQWGERILDGDGKLISFVPVAQFDLANKIQGLDPQYPNLQLGVDSGIRHAWTDTTVNNGVAYWYAVCAYDQGIRADDKTRNPQNWPDFRSLENSRGVDPQLSRNLVRVVPGAAPANYQTAGFAVLPLPGTRGNGHISAELIDPAEITGHTYTISFDDTSSAKLSYSVTDEVTDQIVLQHITRV